MRSTILVALLLVSLSGALSSVIGPWGSFVVDNQYAITSKGKSQNLVLEPLRTNDPNQTWRYEDGYIVSKFDNDTVWDIKQASLKPNSPVIAFSKRENNKNQWWTINANSVISQLAQSLYLKVKTGTFEIVVDYVLDTNCPPAIKFVEPIVGPLTCASYGDPHITCWSGTKFDFQFPGTILLAAFNDHRIFSTQGSCGPGFVSGVTCNKGVVVQPAQGTDYVQIQWNGVVRVNGVIVTVTASLTVNAWITIKKLGNTNYRIELPGGVVTTVDYNFYITITSGNIQPSLCACEGPFPDSTAGHTYGVSYALQNQTESPYTYPPNEPFVYDPTYVPQYEFNTTTQAYDRCSPLQVGPLYDACHTLVNPTPYYNSCLYDVSATNNDTAGAEVARLDIAAYAFDCNEKANKSGTPVVLPASPDTSSVSIPQNYTQNWYFNHSFYITARDALGNPRTTGGDAFVITGTSSPAPVTYTLVDLGNGTYRVSFSPSKVGAYVVSVKLNGKDVAGTPVTINIVSVGNIIYNGLALTFKNRGQQLTFEPLVSDNTKQQWTIQPATGAGPNDNFIVSKYWNTQVLDSKDGSNRTGNPVINWDKKVPNALNQLWQVAPNGISTGIKSALFPNTLYLRTDATNLVFLSPVTPVQDIWYI